MRRMQKVVGGCPLYLHGWVSLYMGQCPAKSGLWGL